MASGIPRAGARESAAIPEELRQQAYDTGAPSSTLGSYREAAEFISKHFEELAANAARGGKSIDAFKTILDKANKENKTFLRNRQLEEAAQAKARAQMEESRRSMKETSEAFHKAGRQVEGFFGKVNDYLSSPLTLVDAALKAPFKILTGTVGAIGKLMGRNKEQALKRKALEDAMADADIAEARLAAKKLSKKQKRGAEGTVKPGDYRTTGEAHPFDSGIYENSTLDAVPLSGGRYLPANASKLALSSSAGGGGLVPVNGSISPVGGSGAVGGGPMTNQSGSKNAGGAMGALFEHYLQKSIKWYDSPASTRVGQFYKSLFDKLGSKQAGGSGEMDWTAIIVTGIIALAAVIVAAIFALKDGIVPILQAIAFVINTVAKIAQSIVDTILRLVNIIIDVIGNIAKVIEAALGVVADIFRGVGDTITTAFGTIRTVMEGVSKLIGTFLEGGSQVAGAAFGAASNVITSAGKGASTIIDAGSQAIADRLGPALDGISKVLTDMWAGVKNFIDILLQPIKTAMEALSGLLNATAEGLKTFINETLGLLTDTMKGLRNFFSGNWFGGDSATKTSSPSKAGSGQPQQAPQQVVYVSNQYNNSFSEMSPFGFNAYAAIGGL